MSPKLTITALQLPGRDVTASTCDGGSDCRRWLDRRRDWFWSQRRNHGFAGEMLKRCVRGQLLDTSIFDTVTDADVFCLENARCNVYDEDLCCGNLYCHEVPNFNSVCKVIGR